MRVAIYGAGFAGCALAFYLQHSGKCQVTLYDKKGIGAGASGIAAGLVHPYVGEEVKRSSLADEALLELRYLLDKAACYSESPIADFSGIDRIAQDDKQFSVMLEHSKKQADISHVEGKKFFISSGMTVQAFSYLQALWRCCEVQGAVFIQKEICSLSALEGYDAILVAIGAGIFEIKELSQLSLDSTRGQIIICRWPPHVARLPRSLVGKGYIALGECPDIVCIGATYERGIRSDVPDLPVALAKLQPQVEKIITDFKIDPLEIRAGVRVSSKGHYFPLIGELKKGIWVMTGLGSRGLLYHALFAKKLATAVISRDENSIPEITLRLLSKNRYLAYNQS